MSHIYVFSPSSAVRDRAAVRRGIERLRALGHEVEVDPAALSRVQRFAGDDDERLAAIGRAAASGADVALATRGGYGLTRLLDRIRYPALSRAAKRGTAFVGVSDFTALQCAMLARADAPSWAGPDLEGDWGAETSDPVMTACFADLTSGAGEGTGWRLPLADARALGIEASDDDTERLLARRATLWGGNLAVLTSLLGTPWFPQVRGGVLFVEDVGEHPYRIERMLDQLRHAGVLARQRALVLGSFTGYRLAPHDRGFKLQTVVQRLRSQLRIPVLSGLPYGHQPRKVLLPVGRPVDLMLQGRDVLLLWGHTH